MLHIHEKNNNNVYGRSLKTQIPIYGSVKFMIKKIQKEKPGVLQMVDRAKTKSQIRQHAKEPGGSAKDQGRGTARENAKSKRKGKVRTNAICENRNKTMWKTRVQAERER